MSEQKYDCVLFKKDGIKGLTIEEVNRIFNMLNETEAFPIEIEAYDEEMSLLV